MSTCCIALGEIAQIRESISKMKMDIQKRKWTVIRTEAFVHTCAYRETEKLIET